MKTIASKIDGQVLRILLVGTVGNGSAALAAWLRERAEFAVSEPATTTAAALGLALRVKPHVVLLDFHGLPISTGYTVSLFKELSPPPLVIVLTLDDSEATRRRCRDAGVDAVFNKSTGLDAIVGLLEEHRKSLV